MPRVLTRHWATLATMVIAAATRLPGLGSPNLLVFDEIYYVSGAAEMLQWGAAHGLTKHPPVGWWLIAGGIEVFGFDPVGWRIAALLAGVATVGLVTATVKRLRGDDTLAFAAGLLCALDGVMFTTSRIGMLDAFVGLAVSIIVYLLALVWTTPPDNRRRFRRMSIWLLVAVGIGSAVKWSVIPLVFVALATMWHGDRSLQPGHRGKAALASLGLALVIPTGAYLACWLPRQVGPAAFTPSSFVQDQRKVLDYHLGLTPTDRNAAPADTWFVIGHPTRLYAQVCDVPSGGEVVGPCRGAAPGSGVLIVAMPNPMVWAVCLIGLGIIAWQAARHRRKVAVGLLAVVATQWLPWLINRRWAYTTYETAIIPTLIVAAAWGIGPRRFRRHRATMIVGLATCVALFAFFYPVWTGHVLTTDQISSRIWWWG